MPYASIAESVPWGWSSYGELLAALDKHGAGLNIGVMAGHSTIRRFVMGERAVGSEATTDEIELMARMLDAALTDGALGFSTSQARTQPTPTAIRCRLDGRRPRNSSGWPRRCAGTTAPCCSIRHPATGLTTRPSTS
jgi:N-acyl-D-aspartate/D-glutamate deacylase